ncbi:uncharacterized protein LOC119870470 isoform X1 [Canis lupus familiaris]|uniref:uncharacterized protein LOC119870470 isoform X1 n=1 Tax=Canis lupus familiaris TaxID=9615 RepID=UPI0018F72A3B|nr:uncharacterized protein LOC119870470 isoform X1 [Canis lupus familiaris]
MRQDNDTLFLLLAPEMVAGDGGRFFLYRMDMSHLADKALAQHLAQRRLWQRKEPAAAVSEAAEQRSEPRSTVVTPLPPPQLMGLGNARTRVARTARGRHEGLLTVPGAQRGTSVPEGFPGARRIWPALAQPETVPGARHRPLAHGMQGRRPGQVIGVLGSRGTGLSPSGPREGAAGPRAGGIVRAVSEVLGFRGGRGRPCR